MLRQKNYICKNYSSGTSALNSENDKLHGKLEEAATDLKIIEKNIVATTI
jgi:hypothetical protein